MKKRELIEILVISDILEKSNKYTLEKEVYDKLVARIKYLKSKYINLL